MIKFFLKYKLHLIRMTAAVFILGAFMGFGNYFVPGNPSETVIRVEREKIPLSRFLNHYQRTLSQVRPGVVLDQQARQQKRDETIRDLVTMTAYRMETEVYGVVVPDDQVRNSLAQMPAFQQNGQFSPEAYVRAIQQQLHVTPQEFEEEQRIAIAFTKLRWMLESAVRVTDAELQWLGPATKDRAAALEALRQQKVAWVLNQWLTQVGNRLRVRPYLDRIERAVPS